MSSIRTVCVCDVDLVVDYDYTPYQPARVSGPPEQCHPAEGGEVEINSVCIDGTEVAELLSDWTLDQIKDQLREHIPSAAEEAACAAEERADQEREERLLEGQT